MPEPRPTVPSPLLDVEVAATRRRAAPVTVLSAVSEDGTVALGGAADELAPGWRVVVLPTGKPGEALAAPTRGGGYAWVLGTGAGAESDYRRAGAALVRAAGDRLAAEVEAGGRGARAVQVLLPEDVGRGPVFAFTLGAILGGYRFAVTARKLPPTLRSLRLVCPDATVRERLAGAVREARVLAGATALTRDLANYPSNVKDPAWLAGTGARACGDTRGLAATVHDERWLADHGFGGILAVGGGSARPPRLLELRWRPRGAARAPHLVLVGKGITFDTGGVSLKPNPGMHMMRTDMAGGAAVIAATRAVAALELPVRVTGLVPAAENHLSGSAYRPGDVVRHYGGRTTEVINTDAEGRMVLADSLAYAVRVHKPDYLLDVATLTGAMKVALGLRTGGVFATSDDLADRVGAAGDAVGESWWRMPLSEEHAAEVHGTVGDVRQAPPGPSGITAALFLREFTGGLPWVHMDIAGPARAESGYDEVVPGATGFAARTLVEFVRGFR